MLLLAIRVADYTVRRVFAVCLMATGAVLPILIFALFLMGKKLSPGALLLAFLLALFYVFLGRWLFRLKPFYPTEVK